MAIGSVRGQAVTTAELMDMAQEDEVTVLVDHERYLVLSVNFWSTGDAKVLLAPEVIGDEWLLEVGKHDADEPIWEIA